MLINIGKKVSQGRPEYNINNIRNRKKQTSNINTQHNCIFKLDNRYTNLPTSLSSSSFNTSTQEEILKQYKQQLVNKLAKIKAEKARISGEQGKIMKKLMKMQKIDERWGEQMGMERRECSPEFVRYCKREDMDWDDEGVDGLRESYQELTDIILLNYCTDIVYSQQKPYQQKAHQQINHQQRNHIKMPKNTFEQKQNIQVSRQKLGESIHTIDQNNLVNLAEVTAQRCQNGGKEIQIIEREIEELQ